MKWSVLLLVGAIVGWMVWPVAGHIRFTNCNTASGNCVAHLDPYPRIFALNSEDKYNTKVLCETTGQGWYCQNEQVAIPVSIFFGASVALIAAALVDMAQKKPISLKINKPKSIKRSRK